MKYKSVLILITLITLLLLNSCVKKPIGLVSFQIPSEIKQGDSALIKWSFKNADKVLVEGIYKDFNSFDSIRVSPKEATNYKIIAIQGNVDSMIQLHTINVISSKIGKGITRGEFKLGNYRLEPSIFDSDYLSGSEEFYKAQNIIKLKILQMKFNKLTRNAVIKAILLDRFGNLIKNINNKDVKWSIRTSFGAISHLFDITEKQDLKKFSEKSNLYTILVDRSASSNISHIIENLKNFILRINTKDSILIASFNQDLTKLIPAVDAMTALSTLDKISFPESNGLSALYSSIYKILKEMESLNNENKYLIILTGNNNDAFTAISSYEISEYANKLGIPIYILGMGYSFDPYPLRYLCHSTGGTYYPVDLDSEVYKIDRMLFEIAYSSVITNYFEFPVPLPVESCKSLIAQLSFTYQNITLTDNINIILKYEEPYQKSRIIALFDHHSDKFQDDYIPLISELANYLIHNPNKKIELIGTRSMEEEILAEQDISLSRAENIKQKLIEMGVKAEQVKANGKGASLPMFYFEKEEWQKAYNRRVEIRWLSPELLPYEIIAETCVSEDEAQKKVDIWEQRGYRAYYERYIILRNPVYKVKIWGFADELEANQTAFRINNKWGTNFKVE